MMSLTVVLAGMSRSLCWRLMASQSSTSHGFSSSGILIFTSTLARNCSSVSTELLAPRFFLIVKGAVLLENSFSTSLFQYRKEGSDRAKENETMHTLFPRP